MACILIPLILLSSFSDDIPPEDRRLWLKHADLVVVAKYTGSTGWYATEFGPDPQTISQPGYVATHGFEVRRIMHGEHSQPDLTAIVPVAEDPDEGWQSGQIQSLREGDLVVMFLHRVRPDRLVAIRSPRYWFRTLSADEYYIPFQWQNAVRIPELLYHAEGATPVEKYVSVISQAFAATRDRKYLTEIASIRPPWDMEDGVPVLRPYPHQEPHDGPTYFSFFSQTIKPRLLQAITDDPVLLSHAYRVIVDSADRSVLPEWQVLTLHLDATWADPEVSFAVATGDLAWTLALINSGRLRTVRVQGINQLPQMRAHAPLIRNLLNEDSVPILAAAVRWCERTFYREFRADPEAPRLPMIYDGRRNYDDDVRTCAAYWKLKLPILG